MAASGFLACRLFLEVGLRARGLRTTGVVQYDSFYPFAFARELAREHHWLLFRNPYGSFDQDPGLVNGPATVARITEPLWDGHLFGFDLVLGIVAAALAGWCFAGILGEVARCDLRTAQILLVFVLVGGGAGFLLQRAGLVHGEAPLLGTAYWGPTWATTNTATWELVYHAIFWGGLLALLRGRLVTPILASIALAFLHPFTIATFALVAVACGLAEWRAREDRELRQGAVVGIVVVFVGATLVFNVLLPERSADARFFLDIFRSQSFRVPLWTMALYVAPALAIFAAAVIRGRSRLRAHTPALAFVFAAAALFALGLSQAFTSVVPTPVHWLRVYPIALLIAAAAAWMGTSERHRSLTVCIAVGIVISTADTALAYRAMLDDLASGRVAHPPATIDRDTARVAAYLRQLPAVKAIYLRSCANARDFPNVEYVLSALTPQKFPLGHDLFSPDLYEREQRFLACTQTPASLRELFKEARYVLIDTAAAKRLHIDHGASFGRFVVLSRSAPAVGTRGRSISSATVSGTTWRIAVR